MNTTTIRSELHNYLEIADDKKVKAMYTIMESEIKDSFVEYPDDLNAILDERFASYKSGEAKMISASESKKRIEKILKSRIKK